VKAIALGLRALLDQGHIVATNGDFLLCLVQVEVYRETSLALRHQVVYNVIAVLILVESEAHYPIKVQSNSLSV